MRLSLGTGRRLPRWTPALFVVLTLALVPWTVWLYMDLPDRARANHWAGVWVGFDIALAVTLGLTGVALFRRSAWAVITASAAGTMLLVDAWFDTMTARSGGPLAAALVMAFAAEIPLAVLCFWVAATLERRLASALAEARRAAGGDPPPAEPRRQAEDPRSYPMGPSR